jgi:protein TonB
MNDVPLRSGVPSCAFPKRAFLVSALLHLILFFLIFSGKTEVPTVQGGVVNEIPFSLDLRVVYSPSNMPSDAEANDGRKSGLPQKAAVQNLTATIADLRKSQNAQPQQAQKTNMRSAFSRDARQEIYTGNGSKGAETPDAMATAEPFGFSLGEVGEKPKVLERVQVAYPEEARRKNISGKVTVRFHLSAVGVISNLQIKSAVPPGLFDKNTLRALGQWRFRPAFLNGKAVPVWVELPIAFNLH